MGPGQLRAASGSLRQAASSPSSLPRAICVAVYAEHVAAESGGTASLPAHSHRTQSADSKQTLAAQRGQSQSHTGQSHTGQSHTGQSHTGQSKHPQMRDSEGAHADALLRCEQVRALVVVTAAVHTPTASSAEGQFEVHCGGQVNLGAANRSENQEQGLPLLLLTQAVSMRFPRNEPQCDSEQQELRAGTTPLHSTVLYTNTSGARHCLRPWWPEQY